MRKLFGLPLNTGIVVVGALSVVLFLYASIHTTYNLVQFLTQETPATPQWIIDPITGEISHGINLKTDDDAKGPKANYTGWIINTDTTVFHVLYVCLSAASLISAIFLIVAGVRNKHRLLIPWLVVGTVGLIGLSLCIIYTIYLFIIYSVNGWCVEATMIIVLVAAIIVLALQIYIWRGIQQFYMDLIDCNERRKILPTTVPLYAPDEAFY